MSHKFGKLGRRRLWMAPNAKSFKICKSISFFHFDFCHDRMNGFSPITSPHMSKSNDLLMYHERLMSNDHLMSTQGGLMMPKLVPIFNTGKYFSEALILESVNPQYDKRLFIEFPEKYKFTTCCVQILFYMSK